MKFKRGGDLWFQDLKFQKQLEEFGMRSQRRMVEATGNAILKLHENIVVDTPVDTGAAASNWFIGVNKASDKTTDDTSLQNVVEAHAVVSAAKVNPNQVKSFVIYNNLDYIPYLEYGWSVQAPQGMYRKNIVKWRKILDAEAKKVSRQR